jgi:hypothetical protein
MSKIVRPTKEEGSCIGIPDVVVAMMTTDRCRLLSSIWKTGWRYRRSLLGLLLEMVDDVGFVLNVDVDILND